METKNNWEQYYKNTAERPPEKEYDGKTAARENKHWHIFDFIVKKQPDPNTSN